MGPFHTMQGHGGSTWFGQETEGPGIQLKAGFQAIGRLVSQVPPPQKIATEVWKSLQSGCRPEPREVVGRVDWAPQSCKPRALVGFFSGKAGQSRRTMQGWLICMSRALGSGL